MSDQPKEGDLRIWHLPNPPREPFTAFVASVDEARHILNAIADYDLYLGDHVISSNAQGLEVFENGEWMEWEDEDHRTIDDIDREEP